MLPPEAARRATLEKVINRVLAPENGRMCAIILSTKLFPPEVNSSQLSLQKINWILNDTESLRRDSGGSFLGRKKKLAHMYD